MYLFLLYGYGRNEGEFRVPSTKPLLFTPRIYISLTSHRAMILQQLYLTKKVNIRLAFPRTPAVQNRDYSESGRIGYEHLNGYGVRDITVSKALKSVSISSDYSSSSQQHCSRRRHVRFITLGQMLQELTCCSPKPKKIQLSFPFCDSSMSFTRSTEDHKISCPFDKICSSLSCERASQEWDTVQEADSE